MIKAFPRPVLLREALGDVLREIRAADGLTLRDVSARAMVSLGYLSEIERGQKEASSELLQAICGALDISLADLLRRVGDRIEPTAEVTQLKIGNTRAAA